MATLSGGCYNTVGSEVAFIFGTLWTSRSVKFLQERPGFEKRWEGKEIGKELRTREEAKEDFENLLYSEGRSFGLPQTRRGDSTPVSDSPLSTTSVLPISHWSTSGGALVLVNVKLMAKAVQQLKQIIIDKSTESWRSSICSSSPSKKLKKKEDNSLLKFLALNALELTAPASDILLRNGNSGTPAPTSDSATVPHADPSHPRWFQLSGHPDCFAPAGPGTIWKKCSGGGERDVYEALRREPELRDIVPRYVGEVEYKGDTFIELEDLLHGFRDPHVMDIKMGTRTFLECEVQNTTARTDLYNKMLAVDPLAPTSEEHEIKAVTKLRYMQFREEQSSTSSKGFRIEAMKFRGAPPVTDLKTVRTPLDVNKTLALFLGGRDDVRVKLLARLRDMRRRLENSKYLQTHEIVGSSILIIYDEHRSGAWLIDFAKTRALPNGLQVNHRSCWKPGNHEEGFLFGLDQLILSLDTIPHLPCMSGSASEPPCEAPPPPPDAVSP